MLFFQVPAMFWALFNSWHNFWFVTALSSPGENTVLPPFRILEAMVSPALSATVVGYHCHCSCISERLLVLPEVHLLWMLPGPPSRTRQKTWSQQVWRTRLISPHQRICWAVTRRICKKSQNVEETGYSEINNKKQTLTQYQRFVTLHSLYIWFIFLGIVNLLLMFFWWNASIDNTFSSTWHSLAFPLLLSGLLRFCWHFSAFTLENAFGVPEFWHCYHISRLVRERKRQRPWELSEFIIFWNCNATFGTLKASLCSPYTEIHTLHTLQLALYQRSKQVI